MPFSQTMGGEDISVTLYYKNIEAVEANKGSRISSSEIFKSTIFDIIAKEGAEIKINLEVDKLNVKGTSGAIITVSGKAKNQDLLINSGSIYNAKSLETEQTTITVNAGGEADIYATNLVDAKVRAGGNITIYGKPRQINQKVVAGGSIREAK
jgi:protoporphyrinogen oxidase